MKRQKNELPKWRKFKLAHLLLGLGGFYLIFMCFKFSRFMEMSEIFSGDNSNAEGSGLRNHFFSSSFEDAFQRKLIDDQNQAVPSRPKKEPLEDGGKRSSGTSPNQHQYNGITVEIMRRSRTNGLSAFERMEEEAWTLGLKAWEEMNKHEEKEIGQSSKLEGQTESCPSWISVKRKELKTGDGIVFLPCGLAVGSSITIVGTPHHAHPEYVPQLARSGGGNATVMISHFVVELRGLNSVDGEEAPKILHLNPRIKGDWSQLPVIEHNTCYRMQWGEAQRCDGSPSNNDEDLRVDGFRRCEKWMRSDIDSKEYKTSFWFKRFMGRKKKPEITWPFPFMEGRLFAMTVRTGVDGYHISVGGRHVSSFPYRMGFSLEDATGLAIEGDVDVHSVHATSLPTTHPSFSPLKALEMSEEWKSHPLPKTQVRLLVGVLSATNHFAERMAIRKTWMQSSQIKSSDIAVRFFVSLSQRKEANSMLKKEAAYFGDIVILPFIDHYELVVLKTIAICEFGVQNVTAAYIMKCDDDTFVRLDTVLREIDGVPPEKSVYMGNLNLLHRPLRHGKWAVTYEEWPEAIYPPYANGPGYVISMDIAKFISAQHANRRLRLFKMEDVSMGMWVEQFNSSTAVQYIHNWKFCQYGCMDDYYSAHYQSPRQMICLWDKLLKGKAQCCNFRR